MHDEMDEKMVIMIKFLFNQSMRDVKLVVKLQKIDQEPPSKQQRVESQDLSLPRKVGLDLRICHYQVWSSTPVKNVNEFTP